MKRGRGLSSDPARAAERRARREQRRASLPPRPEDIAREARRKAREAPQSAVAAEDREAARAWNAAAKRQGCAMCKAKPVSAAVRRDRGAELARVEGHHIIEKSELKRWGLYAALWDLRNLLGLCVYHHARHTLAFERVPRELLPVAAFEFADEIGARFVLEDDRVYPGRGA